MNEAADADKPHLAAEMKVYPYCEKWALSWDLAEAFDHEGEQ